MPLFIFVSGYLAFGRVERCFVRVVRRKSVQLVVPFLAWTLVTSLITTHPSFGHTLHSYYLLYLSPDNGLWFLWVLFLAFVLTAALLSTDKLPHAAVLIAATVLLRAFHPHLLGAGLLAWHYPFFAVGYAVASWPERSPKWRAAVCVACAVVFVALAPTWHREAQPWFYASLTAHGIRGADQIVLAYRYLVAFAGIGAFSGLFFYLTRLSRRRLAVLGWFGVVTMDIYVSHQIFLGIHPWPANPVWLAICLTFAVALGGSLALSFLVLRRSRVLSGVFLGNWGSRGQQPAAPRRAAAEQRGSCSVGPTGS